MTRADDKLKGRKKAAALLITLGKERSSEILRHLSDEDIERLGLLNTGQDVLRKPFTPEALADRARRLVSA